MSSFADNLRSIRSTSNSCIISCLTNFLTDVPRSSSLSVQARVEPVLEDVKAVLLEFMEIHPDMLVLVAPPMYRLLPEWYHDHLPEILLQFSKILSPLQKDRVHLLPSFSGSDIESDGVHLTPYAGLKFVVHLFDASLDIVKSLAAPLPEGVARVGELSRVLEDRVSVLEQDSRHYRQEFQLKTARDSELADFEENLRNECYFVISGLPQVPSGLVGRAWQEHAKGLVQDKIKLILGRESRIVVVSGLRRDENPVYLVKLESVDNSKRIRDKFGSYFKAGAPAVPPELKGLSIRIRLTHATRVRIAIMQALASNYKSSNPGSKVQVVNFEPRPMMRLTPPQNASDPRILTFNFIEAVTKLPARFSKKDLAYILKTTSGKFKGELRSLFVVLSDDLRDQGSRSRQRGRDGHRQRDEAPQPDGGPSRVSRSRSQSRSSSDSGSGSGSETDQQEPPPVDDSTTRRRSSTVRMETDVPPPGSSSKVPPPVSTVSVSGRGSKRGPPSPKGSKNKSKSRH